MWKIPFTWIFVGLGAILILYASLPGQPDGHDRSGWLTLGVVWVASLKDFFIDSEIRKFYSQKLKNCCERRGFCKCLFYFACVFFGGTEGGSA